MTELLDTPLQGAEARLWKLIASRTEAGADTEAIDRRIWDLFGEDWVVMATDLAGFSRGVAEFGIIHFLQIIYEHKKVLFPIVDAHDGVLVKAEADSLLLLFKRPTVALECAIAMQHACQQLSMRRVPHERVLLCIGIGAGRVLRIGESDVFGEAVNAASKLGEDTAKASEILVTRAVKEGLGDRPGVEYEALEAIVGCDKPFRVVYPMA